MLIKWHPYTTQSSEQNAALQIFVHLQTLLNNLIYLIHSVNQPAIDSMKNIEL